MTYVGRLLGVLLGILMILLGLTGTIFGVIAVLDPAGTQLSNDADPFGTPPSWQSSVALTAAYAVVGLAGGALVVWTLGGRRWKRQNSAETVPPAAPAGWFTDPTGRHQLRYWDGDAWGSSVSDGGVQSLDPT